jgi:hypothetical protein
MVPLLLSQHTLRLSALLSHMLPSPQFHMLPLNLLMVLTVLNMPLKSSAQQFHMPPSPLLLHQSPTLVMLVMLAPLLLPMLLQLPRFLI